MDDVFKELQERQAGGARHRNLVEYLRNTKHSGCDVSEDGTMIITYFADGSAILVAPYGIIKKLNKR